MPMIKKQACVLTIAGSDSSGGAGIQADIKAISATGSYAASVITAITSQNTVGVQDIYALPAAVITTQLESVLSDLDVHAIKIGMLFNESIIQAIESILEKYTLNNIVLDPVMISKSGCELLPSATIDYLTKHLFPFATLITPNLNEAEKLLGKSINNKASTEAAAKTLGERYETNILVKGGHANEEKANDVLYSHHDSACYWYESVRIHSKNTHGTGCTLSSAIASYLAQGYPLQEAIFAAKEYLTKAIQSGSFIKIGHGVGPVDHFYFQKRIIDDI